MDPIVLSRLSAAWREELVGAAFAGLIARTDGFTLVFDRAPEGARPGRRSALCVRLAPPVWAWTEPPIAAIADWTFRLPAGATLTSLTAPPMDRRLVLDLATASGHTYRIHVELWPPGNVLIEESDQRLLWCARTRPASAFRAALAPGLAYSPPPAAYLVDPERLTAADLNAWLPAGQVTSAPRLAIVARQVAGLPKGLLEVLAPTLPRALTGDTALDADALARDLALWARATYGGEPPVRGYVWDWPSPGAALLTRALDMNVAGVRFTGSYSSWSEAARELARALPKPIDPALLAGAKARLRRLQHAEIAVLEELEEAREAAALRARATTLVSFLSRVPKGASSVALPDPSEPGKTVEITLDPKLRPHENADRMFKRAGKLARIAEQAPARLAEVREDLARARVALERVARGEMPEPALARRASGRSRPGAADTPAKRKRDDTPSVLIPRRYRTTEGWEVLIGKNNQGNDHLTHRLARPEDYWMHVHGAAGSHVVLRRGKGANEPSKATLEEVAGWAAFYSQARNAGTVPVTVTQKKYVTKPRKAPAGLAQVTRSKTVFARPTEPPDEARAEADGD